MQTKGERSQAKSDVRRAKATNKRDARKDELRRLAAFNDLLWAARAVRDRCAFVGDRVAASIHYAGSLEAALIDLRDVLEPLEDME